MAECPSDRCLIVGCLIVGGVKGRPKRADSPSENKNKNEEETTGKTRKVPQQLEENKIDNKELISILIRMTFVNAFNNARNVSNFNFFFFFDFLNNH